MNYSYERIVNTICGNDWCGPESTPDDIDGGLGVAIMLAYLQSSNSRLPELAKMIEVPSYLLETAYKRLQINGLFSPRSWVLRDPLLLSGESSNVSNHNSALIAWCFIAGMASGYTGRGFTREEFIDRYGQKEKIRNES